MRYLFSTLLFSLMVWTAIATMPEDNLLTPQERVAKRILEKYSSSAVTVEIPKGVYTGFIGDSHAYLNIFVWKGCEYIIANNSEIIHSYSCTNHAPTVVTQKCEHVESNPLIRPINTITGSFIGGGVPNDLDSGEVEKE